jgi:hypothetical protein
MPDRVDCKHLTLGACDLGKFGGRPSPGRCGQCEVREPRPRDSTSVGPSFDLDDDAPAIEAARQTVARGGCCGSPAKP